MGHRRLRLPRRALSRRAGVSHAPRVADPVSPPGFRRSRHFRVIGEQRAKIDEIRGELPGLRHVIAMDADAAGNGALAFAKVLENAFLVQPPAVVAAAKELCSRG